MIDFEIVSIGLAVADIATFLFMRTNPAYRKKYEREFLKIWYERLISGGNCKAENYSWDQCWEDYKFEGAARFAFYLAGLPVFVHNKF